MRTLEQIETEIAAWSEFADDAWSDVAKHDALVASARVEWEKAMSRYNQIIGNLELLADMKHEIVTNATCSDIVQV